MLFTICVIGRYQDLLYIAHHDTNDYENGVWGSVGRYRGIFAFP